MYDNNTYNLMAQIVEESQSLYRIKKTYKSDAEDCDECKEYWQKLQEDKEQHLDELENLLKKHI